MKTEDEMQTTNGSESVLGALLRAAREGFSAHRARRGPTPARNRAARTGSRSHVRQVERKRARALNPCPGCARELIANVPPPGERSTLGRCGGCKTLIFFNRVTQQFQKRSVGWERRHPRLDHRSPTQKRLEAVA